jgi:hypothetical protein
VNKFIKPLMGKGSYVIGLAIASLLGGLISAVALAAIPDSGGVIHSCYKSKNGNMHVIDTAAGGHCTAQETALNWNQTATSGSSAPVLHDANGQVLGDIVDFNAFVSQNDTNTVRTYNHTLNRVISITYDFGIKQFLFGSYLSVGYTSSDCSGQPYLFVTDNPGTSSKTSLLRWNNGSSEVYGVVANSTAMVHVTDGSTYVTDGHTYFCRTDGNDPVDAFAVTTVSLPFNTPVAAPFKF